MTLRALLGRRKALWSAVAIGVVAVVLVSVLATRGVAPSSQSTTFLGGQAAPPISGTNLLTGRAVSLRSFAGEYVVVDFFASWCSPCQTEAPDLEAFEFAHHASHDATVLGVVYGDSASNAIRFLHSTGATWPAVTDPDAQIAVSYGVSSPPRTFVVAPDGKVIGSAAGAVTEASLNEILARNGGSAT